MLPQFTTIPMKQYLIVFINTNYISEPDVSLNP